MSKDYKDFFKQAQRVATHSSEGTRGEPVRQLSQLERLARKASQKSSPKDAARQSAKQPQAQRTRMHPTTPMAEQLRQRLIQKRKAAKKRKVSWPMLALSIAGMAATCYGLTRLSDVEKIAKKVEISFMGVAMADEAPAKEKAAATKPAEAAADAKGKDGKDVAAKDAGKEDTAGTKHEYTDEEISHLSKLNDRKRELDAREEELNRMEAELTQQREEMEKRLTKLEQTRRQISSVLEERVQTDDKKVDSLVQIYSTMKPQQAAKIFETMDEDLAIEILGRMKKKPASEILNLVKAEKAQVLSEKYAGYKRSK